MLKKYKKLYRIKKRGLFFSRRFWGEVIFTFILIGGFFYFLFFSDVFKIKEIIINSNEKHLVETIKFLLNKKNKNIFLANLNEIKKDILNNFPQIAEIEISRKFPSTLNISVIKRIEMANWCYKENCFLLDGEGVIFKKKLAPNLTKIIEKRIKTSENINFGEKVLEKELINRIFKIERELKKNLNISIKEFLIISEERLNVKTSRGWEIYFNLKEDLDWQITKLNLVFERQISPEQRKNLEYIDLRFSKVYYKYK